MKLAVLQKEEKLNTLRRTIKMTSDKKNDKETMEIHDFDKRVRVLGVNLNEVLECLGDIGGTYHWNIIYLEARGNLGPDKSMVDFEDKINNSVQGIEISWQELMELASKLYEVNDIKIIGNKTRKKNLRENNTENYHISNDIVLECVDSSYWVITTDYQPFIQKIKNKFNDVRFAIPAKN